MKANLLESFELLLDTEYQRHIIEVMGEWCGNTNIKLNAAHADLVDKEISRPLWVWIGETRSQRKAGNYQDIEVAKAFVNKADDIFTFYDITPARFILSMSLCLAIHGQTFNVQ